MKKRDQDFEKMSPVLKRIAESFPIGSIEEKAIKTAAHALWFLQSHDNLKALFSSHLAKAGKPLSKFHLKALHSMGIDSNIKKKVVINKK